MYELVATRICTVESKQITLFGHTAVINEDGSLTLNGVVLEAWCPRMVAGTGKIVQWCPRAKVETQCASVAITEEVTPTEPELVVLCGLENDATEASPGYTYNRRQDKWRNNTALQEQRDEAAILAHRNKIYAIGGCNDNRQILASVEVYEVEHDRWSTLAPMSEARRQCGAVFRDDALYVVGGTRAGRALAAAEVYCGNPACWTTLANMPTARSGLGLATLGSDLYACGGSVSSVNNGVFRNDGGARQLNTVEIYNTETALWREGAPLNTPRANFGIATLGGRIFVIGGKTNDAWKNLKKEASVECYDQGRWSVRSPMPTARSHVSLAVLGSFIFVIGGHGMYDSISTIEVYDWIADKWFQAAPLPSRRWGHGSVWVNTSRTLSGTTVRDNHEQSKRQTELAQSGLLS